MKQVWFCGMHPEPTPGGQAGLSLPVVISHQMRRVKAVTSHRVTVFATLYGNLLMKDSVMENKLR